MSLSGALQIGRSGLLAHQAAIQTAGNNLANVATPGYHRQQVTLAPMADQEVQRGIFIGRGVTLDSITRQVNEALDGRVRNSVADESAASARQDVLSQIESLQGELSDSDLSTHLSEFFNAWSELANNPLDNAVRSVVTQQGQTLASFVQNLRSELGDLRAQVDRDISSSAQAADDLLTQIEGVNTQIAQMGGGDGGAAGLRDQRDNLLTQLSQYMEVSTVEQPSGSVDVYVGSTPIVLNGKSRGVEVKRETVNGELKIRIQLKADGTELVPRSGKLGALIESRETDVNNAVEQLDEFSNNLIYEVNRVHSQGQGTSGYTSITGTSKVSDTTVKLSAAGLDFTPTHGSFEVTVLQKSTGQKTTSTINVDLDGINSASDTSLDDLITQLNGVANLSAAATADGRLRINTASGDFEITFGQDSSGTLAALGINTFFSGHNGSDIEVNATIANNPGKLAAAQGNIDGDNRNALSLAGLRERGLTSLNGLSLSEAWNRNVEDYAVRLGQAKQKADSATVVKENLAAQQQSVSGVNSDEEAIDLLSYQRAYQASARFLTVVDQLFQTLLDIQ